MNIRNVFNTIRNIDPEYELINIDDRKDLSNTGRVYDYPQWDPTTMAAEEYVKTFKLFFEACHVVQDQHKFGWFLYALSTSPYREWVFRWKDKTPINLHTWDSLVHDFIECTNGYTQVEQLYEFFLLRMSGDVMSSIDRYEALATQVSDILPQEALVAHFSAFVDSPSITKPIDPRRFLTLQKALAFARRHVDCDAGILNKDPTLKNTLKYAVMLVGGMGLVSIVFLVVFYFVLRFSKWLFH